MKSKLITALIAFAVAVGIWFYVVTVISPNSDKNIYNIKVEAVGERDLNDKGLMITNMDDLSAVSLHLEGNRADLNKLSSDNINISMDVSKLSQAGIHELSYDIVFPGDVASNAITVLNKNPGLVRVVVEERISKPVPVQIQYKGTLQENYMADKENAELSVENVTVTGPKPVVDRIAAAQIEVDLGDRKENLNEKFTYSLCDAEGKPVDAKGVNTDVAEISLALRIMRVKEISLKLDTVYGGGATDQTTVITITPPSILISGSDALLENLEELVLDTVNLAEVAEDTELNYTIKLPEGVNNETGENEVKVSITFPELATKKLTVKNLRAVNVPAGFKVELITKVLPILVRGPKDKIDALTEESITVTVDFTATEEGKVMVKATITCADPEVGAVGSYTVSADVKKIA